jgi:AcrR family transcriptional regulator
MTDVERRSKQLRRADPALRAGKLGQRELNKLDKRQRIRTAARELFSKFGYEEATLRQIAKRAHVGLGTLFNYADDKRDLIFLIFNEELDAIAERAAKSVRPDDRFLDQLVAFFRVYYREFSKEALLSRILLQELTFYSHGKQAAQFQKHRIGVVARIEAVVQAAQQAKRIRASDSAALVAQHIFFLYSTAVRYWIGGDAPDPDKGIEDFRVLMRLQIEGLAPAKGELT